ncbi:hypothetical protein PY650_05845 [Rhizobium calliandrae]|uniref:Uncharacterized protein n=1 Tax=Rhizobium calliandrae TaxID=1312182 RepID=A0ABT7KB43_9HYPH|nr:hypothetical protein [Rhizobium calliandrae]MDL2405183.1 hypothetical protein [Rhizobium calliandrae]
MNFAKDRRFIEALEVALTSVPEDVAAKIRDIAAMPATDVAEIVEFVERHAPFHTTKDEVLVYLQDRSRRLLCELFAKRWRLGDGWLSAGECKRALFLELDPLSIQMSLEFAKVFVPSGIG